MNVSRSLFPLTILFVSLSAVACSDGGPTSTTTSVPEMSNVRAVAAVAPETVTHAAEPSPDEPAIVQIELASSSGLGRDSLVYARFRINAAQSVAGVRLHIEGEPGLSLEEVAREDWVSRGRGGVVEVPTLQAHESHDVFVAFATDGANHRVRARVSFRDVVARATTVTEPPIELALTSGMRDADVLVEARRAYTMAALLEAAKLQDDRRFEDALEVVRDARARNVEVGLAMRVSGQLERAQSDLAEAEAEIEEARKPKPKPRPRPVRKIEFI